MAAALLPLAGSHAAQAMRRTSSALFGIYTDALQAGFTRHKDMQGMLPATLGGCSVQFRQQSCSTSELYSLGNGCVQSLHQVSPAVACFIVHLPS